MSTWADGLQRCWPGDDPLYLTYHDEEWGRPVTTEQGIYERLCLEGFQSGLSWLSTLSRIRDEARLALANQRFSVRYIMHAVPAYDES